MPQQRRIRPSEKITSQEYGIKAIENGFPFANISIIAEAESWRKEVYRPIYHLHKWWAQRLGSVFRSIILASALEANKPIDELFYKKVDLSGLVVFDPFMGSGTTIGEAVKLGCTAIGRDINPVAFNNVRAIFSNVTEEEVKATFTKLEQTVGVRIKSLYRLKDGSEVLYYFWVKQVVCPECGGNIDLFNDYIFSRHVYPSRNPQSQCLCPSCNEVFPCRFDSTYERCPVCGELFNPQQGQVTRSKAKCASCHSEFPVIEAIKAVGRAPSHRMYAKIVLRKDGEKEYRRITTEDLLAFAEAGNQLKKESSFILPVEIMPGYNTNQVLNYYYTRWEQFFNDRQLLALSWLGRAIQGIDNPELRFVFGVLFSGTIEFNNMFCSFKGEGTGAVRHMFSHHILKPERQPLEANVWGTPKSSGSFSTLFKLRLLRALEYKQNPFEVRPVVKHGKIKGSKYYGCNWPISSKIYLANSVEELKEKSVYLSCGDSAKTDLKDKSVDMVITDPPFFDNVHYSELADFFYAWQQALFGGRDSDQPTTRTLKEVQDGDATLFGKKLAGVFTECHRVLKDDGLLVFTYHHSRDDGWFSVAYAVMTAGFSFVAAQPIRSEMSVASPKNQSKDPINLDIILVCRKSNRIPQNRKSLDEAYIYASRKSLQQIAQFHLSGITLSRNDLRIIFRAHLLVNLNTGRSIGQLQSDFKDALSRISSKIEQLYQRQNLPNTFLSKQTSNSNKVTAVQRNSSQEQLKLFTNF